MPQPIHLLSGDQRGRASIMYSGGGRRPGLVELSALHLSRSPSHEHDDRTRGRPVRPDTNTSHTQARSHRANISFFSSANTPVCIGVAFVGIVLSETVNPIAGQRRRRRRRRHIDRGSHLDKTFLTLPFLCPISPT